MTDRDASPAFSLNPDRVAVVFYEMHTLCENSLSMNIQERHMVSLGYLLYGAADRILLITTLKWTCPDLIIGVHRQMLRVCHEALYQIAQRGCKVSAITLQEYDEVMRMIRHRLKLLEQHYQEGGKPDSDNK